MTYRDRRGYERYSKEHTDLVHRNRAYHIYLENRDKYPLPYSAYEVHHIDFNKHNNHISNLQILTPTEHDRIHDERRRQEEEVETITERKLIFLKPIIFHLIALIILWAITLVIIFSIMFDSGILGFFAFLSGFFSEIKWWETILTMLIAYLFLGSWWVEMIRKRIENRFRILYKKKEYEKPKRNNRKKRIIKFIVILSLIIIILFIYNKSNTITQVDYQKLLETRRSWNGETSCSICDSVFGKENVGGCGGIPNYDFLSCSVNNEVEQVGNLLVNKNYYLDIYTHKKISEAETKIRMKRWDNFFEKNDIDKRSL